MQRIEGAAGHSHPRYPVMRRPRPPLSTATGVVTSHGARRAPRDITDRRIEAQALTVESLNDISR